MKEQLKKILEEALGVIASAQKGEELENARLSQLDALMGIQDSSGMIEEWYSSQGPDRLRSPEQVMDGIRAVTREQVIEAAKTIAHDCVFTLTPDRKEETA